MQISKLIDIVRSYFSRTRVLAFQPVASRRRALSVLVVVLCLGLTRWASATVTITGSVTPADNPFTSVNEGLPSSGNNFQTSELVNKQTFFEGRHLDNNLADPNDDTNVNFDVLVGITSYGALNINSGSALRDQTLTIGDSGLLNGVTSYGTGFVRITNTGSVYNNNPFILPGQLQGVPNFASQTPRLTDVGFDLYVGKAGTGTLEISAGGRAEIQDAVVVANTPTSYGTILVDGLDSFLGSGAFDAGASTSTDPHAMLIGRQGVGSMTVTNGGTVRADAPTGGIGTGNVGPVGAVIGGDAFVVNDIFPDPGGFGTVTIDGTASKWMISGSLQIGGFTYGTTGVLLGDPEGDNVVYGSQAGRGTLNVQSGATVNVLNALNADMNDPRLILAIGRFGRINMAGGLINIGGNIDVTQTNEARANSVQLINDGIISGSGRIETGVFNNRYLGEVRIGAGQTLVVDSSSDVTGINASLPLTNYGVMQVFGTDDARAELEFDRAPTTSVQPVQPFQNLRVARPTGAPITDFYGGLISAQHATLRFRSGLQNSGMMAFTAGNNYVTGNVINMPAIAPAPPGDTGIINISGPNTKVTFEDDLINLGSISINGGATLEILARHSFVTTGDLKMQITPTNANQIISAGDAGIAGKLSISLSGFSAGSLHVGDLFPILSVSGSIGGVDLTNPLYPVPDLSKAPSFSLVSFPNLAAFGLPATTALLPVYTSNAIYVSVVSYAAATGPDFNGDGVVNNLDLKIWLANVGLTSGASVVQGDADGDGDVDGDDFLFWQRNAGKPMPWSGAGVGSGAAVPEPTTALLLVVGGMCSLAARRRRSAS